MGRLLDEDDVIDAISKILSERCGGNTVWWKPVAEAVVNNLPSAQPDLIAKIQNGINTTNANDNYSCGMRNGMRWCMSLVDGKEPLFENCPSAQPERAKGYIEIKVISLFDGEDCYCSECGANSLLPSDKFCRKCGVEFIGVRGEQDE